MRTTIRILLCSTLLAACGQEEDPAPGPSVETGKGGSSGSSGSKPSSGGSTGSTSTGGSTGSGGASSSGGSTGAGGAPAPAPSVDAAAPAGDTAPAASDAAPASSAGAPYGCAACKSIFDGTTLTGWETVEGAWVARAGVLASTGKPNDIYTKEDYGNVRIFFEVRQEKGNHKPGTILFGTRPAAPASAKRGLGGAQFQPPNGAFWNYGAGGSFKRLLNPNFDVTKWHQCEVLAKEAGSFRAACCVKEEGKDCKGTEVLQWTGGGKKFPFGIQMHNAGLFDEYRNIFVEVNPTTDDLLSLKAP